MSDIISDGIDLYEREVPFSKTPEGRHLGNSDEERVKAYEDMKQADAILDDVVRDLIRILDSKINRIQVDYSIENLRTNHVAATATHNRNSWNISSAVLEKLGRGIYDRAPNIAAYDIKGLAPDSKKNLIEF